MVKWGECEESVRAYREHLALMHKTLNNHQLQSSHAAPRFNQVRNRRLLQSPSLNSGQLKGKQKKDDLLPLFSSIKEIYNPSTQDTEVSTKNTQTLPSRRLFICLVAKSSLTLQFHGLQSTRLLCLWDFSRQEYWGGLPFSSPGDLPNPGIEPPSPESPALAGRLFTTEPPRKSYPL